MRCLSKKWKKDYILFEVFFVAILFGAVSGVEMTHFTFKSILGTLLEEGRGIVSWRILTAVLDDSDCAALTCLTRKWETGAQMKEENLQRGPEKEEASTLLFLRSFLHIHTEPVSLKHGCVKSPVIHTTSLSLSWLATREHRMMPHILVFFLLEVIGLLTKREELPVSCCLLLYTCFGYLTFCLIHAICSLISTAWGTVVLQSLNDPS